MRTPWPATGAFLALGGCIFLLGACDLGSGLAHCQGISTQLIPGDTTVTVGESFEPRVRQKPCDGDPTYFDVERLSTRDTAVVSIDGHQVAAGSPGSAIVVAMWLGNEFDMTVRVEQ